jgi:hypothetical protein
MTALRNALSDKQLAEQAEHGEPEKARWSQLEQLTATVIDRLAVLEFVLRSVYSDGKNKPQPPEPVRRPGARPKNKPKAPLTAEGADLLFRLINGDTGPEAV